MSAAGFAECSLGGWRGSEAEQKPPLSGRGGETPVSGNSGRGTQRSGGASRRSGSLAALQRSGVKRLEFSESGSAGGARGCEGRKGRSFARRVRKQFNPRRSAGNHQYMEEGTPAGLRFRYLARVVGGLIDRPNGG